MKSSIECCRRKEEEELEIEMSRARTRPWSGFKRGVRRYSPEKQNELAIRGKRARKRDIN
jgi:hypothetical protein